MLHEDNRPLKGEGRLTDNVLREKLRQGRGPIIGRHDEPPRRSMPQSQPSRMR
jgi:hypothetical protein